MGSVLKFDDPTLLRAARVGDVLRGCGGLLGNSAGSADTYELSSRVDWIDVFISHNWALGRRRKFMALAMHFNLDMACKAQVAAMVSASYVSSVAQRRDVVVASVIPIVCSASVLAFLAAFFFGHDVQAALGFRGKRAFLDKVCIHQTDMGLKARGIRNLGAFLHRSDSMVVCFTGLYLKRLWTVYEFATFLLVRHDSCPGAIHIMPANLPLLVIASSLCFLCATAVWRTFFLLLDSPAIFTGATALSFLCLQGMVTAGSRWWARRQDEARAHFEHFALDRASCVSELDRTLVRKNIVALMRHFSHVGPHVSDADVLQVFDEFVRTAGLCAFSASVGGLGVSYRLILPFLLTTFSHTLQNFTNSCVYPGNGFETAWQTALQLLAMLGNSFLMVPLTVALSLQLTKRCLALRGALEVLYCVGVGLLETAFQVALDPLFGRLRPWLLDAALERSEPLPFLLYTVALFAATAVVYRQPRRKVGAAVASTASAGSSSAPGVAKPETSASAEHGCEAGDLEETASSPLPGSEARLHGGILARTGMYVSNAHGGLATHDETNVKVDHTWGHKEVEKMETKSNVEHDCEVGLEAETSAGTLDVPEAHIQETHLDPAAPCVFGSIIRSGTVVQLTGA